MSQEKRKVYLDEVYEDARDDLNNFSYHSSDEESSYPSSSLSLSLSLDSDSGSKNVPIKKNKTSHNIIFDMLSDYHGYARRIGNESDCFIEYEYKNNILSINQFICTKGGKQLLDDFLPQGVSINFTFFPTIIFVFVFLLNNCFINFFICFIFSSQDMIRTCGCPGIGSR